MRYRIVGAWKLCILAVDLQILCAPNSLSPSKSQLCGKQTTLFHKFATPRKNDCAVMRKHGKFEAFRLCFKLGFCSGGDRSVPLG
jgi:hypothetical protein